MRSGHLGDIDVDRFSGAESTLQAIPDPLQPVLDPHQFADDGALVGMVRPAIGTIAPMTTVYRHAESGDVARITAIYNTVIVDSHVSFDAEPQTVAQRTEWLASKTRDGLYQAWVAEVDSDVVGVAYSTPWKPKSGYVGTVETTIVFEPVMTGRGLGRGLMERLLESITRGGALQAIAVVALPNEPSIRFHHAMGYRTVGVLEDVGTKLGKRWSTEILQRAL